MATCSNKKETEDNGIDKTKMSAKASDYYDSIRSSSTIASDTEVKKKFSGFKDSIKSTINYFKTSNLTKGVNVRIDMDLKNVYKRLNEKNIMRMGELESIFTNSRYDADTKKQVELLLRTYMLDSLYNTQGNYFGTSDFELFKSINSFRDNSVAHSEFALIQKELMESLKNVVQGNHNAVNMIKDISNYYNKQISELQEQLKQFGRNQSSLDNISGDFVGVERFLKSFTTLMSNYEQNQEQFKQVFGVEYSKAFSSPLNAMLVLNKSIIRNELALKINQSIDAFDDKDNLFNGSKVLQNNLMFTNDYSKQSDVLFNEVTDINNSNQPITRVIFGPELSIMNNDSMDKWLSENNIETEGTNIYDKTMLVLEANSLYKMMSSIIDSGDVKHVISLMRNVNGLASMLNESKKIVRDANQQSMYEIIMDLDTQDSNQVNTVKRWIAESIIKRIQGNEVNGKRKLKNVVNALKGTNNAAYDVIQANKDVYSENDFYSFIKGTEDVKRYETAVKSDLLEQSAEFKKEIQKKYPDHVLVTVDGMKVSEGGLQKVDFNKMINDGNILNTFNDFANEQSILTNVNSLVLGEVDMEAMLIEGMATGKFKLIPISVYDNIKEKLSSNRLSKDRSQWLLGKVSEFSSLYRQMALFAPWRAPGYQAKSIVSNTLFTAIHEPMAFREYPSAMRDVLSWWKSKKTLFPEGRNGELLRSMVEYGGSELDFEEKIQKAFGDKGVEETLNTLQDDLDSLEKKRSEGVFKDDKEYNKTLGRVMSNALTNNKVMRFSKELTRIREMHARYALAKYILGRLDAGKEVSLGGATKRKIDAARNNIEKAVLLANQNMIDYNDMPQLIRTMNNIRPFFTFTYGIGRLSYNHVKNSVYEFADHLGLLGNGFNPKGLARDVRKGLMTTFIFGGILNGIITNLAKAMGWMSEEEELQADQYNKLNWFQQHVANLGFDVKNYAWVGGGTGIEWLDSMMKWDRALTWLSPEQQLYDLNPFTNPKGISGAAFTFASAVNPIVKVPFEMTIGLEVTEDGLRTPDPRYSREDLIAQKLSSVLGVNEFVTMYQKNTNHLLMDTAGFIDESILGADDNKYMNYIKSKYLSENGGGSSTLYLLEGDDKNIAAIKKAMTVAYNTADRSTFARLAMELTSIYEAQGKTKEEIGKSIKTYITNLRIDKSLSKEEMNGLFKTLDQNQIRRLKGALQYHTEFFGKGW